MTRGGRRAEATKSFRGLQEVLEADRKLPQAPARRMEHGVALAIAAFTLGVSRDAPSVSSARSASSGRTRPSERFLRAQGRKRYVAKKHAAEHQRDQQREPVGVLARRRREQP